MVGMNWKLWLLITEILFSLCGVSHGQSQQYFSETTSRMVGEPRSDVVTGWKTFKPVREWSEPNTPSILADIESHLPADKSLRAKYESNPITWGHEDCHALNNYLSRQFGPSMNAFYCLNDRGAVFRDPNIFKPMVERAVPPELRGENWKQYMTGVNPDTPMVIIDEWIAFINGAALMQQMYGSQKEVVTSRHSTPSPQGVITDTTSLPLKDAAHAVEFMGYATVLLQCIEQYDPNYPDLEKLADFIAWNTTRTLALTKLHPQEKLVHVYAQRFFRSGTANCANGQCQVPTWSQGQWTRQTIDAGSWRPAQPQQPAQPPLVKVQPVPAAPVQACQCAGEIASLKATISKLEARLESQTACNCEPPKPTNVVFVDGAGKVYQRQTVPPGGTITIPPNHVQNFSRDGKLIDEEKYPVGTPIKLRHGVPSKVK